MAHAFLCMDHMPKKQTTKQIYKILIFWFLKIQHQYSDHPKMKGEEPPKKPDGEGGTGKEEEDSEGPVAMDDDGDVDREEEEDELDDLTAEGETHLR